MVEKKYSFQHCDEAEEWVTEYSKDSITTFDFMDFEEGNKILKTCDNFSDADEHEHDHDKDYEYSDKKEIKK